MPDTHIEVEQVPGRRLGCRPHDPDRPVLRLANILTGAVPDHPVAVDHFAEVGDWGLYGNDRYGDCGPTSVANSRKLVTRYLGVTEQSPTQSDVFDLYRRSGNPAFDPTTGAGDNGVEMATMLAEVRKGGIGSVHSLAEAKVDVTNPDEVRAAIDIFGFLLLGVDLQVAQQNEPALWDYVPSNDWGGHAVLAGTYTSQATGADESVISWATKIGVTDAFWAQQVQEAWVVIWPEAVNSAAFQQGIDTDTLNADFMALTGKPGPFPHGNTPTPTPAPQPAPKPHPVHDPADVALAHATYVWRQAKGI